MLQVLGDKEVVETILTKQMTGCGSGCPDAVLLVEMERVYGQSVRDHMEEVEVPIPIHPELQEVSGTHLARSLMNGKDYQMRTVDGVHGCSFFLGVSCMYIASIR